MGAALFFGAHLKNKGKLMKANTAYSHSNTVVVGIFAISQMACWMLVGLERVFRKNKKIIYKK